MKALVKSKPEPGLWLQEVPIPSIKEDEVLIKIKATAICGTDLHIYEWNTWAQKTIPIPLIIGHEFMGEIVQVGKNVHHLNVGDRISGEGHITCGFCRNCREERQHLCPNARGIGVQINGACAEFFAFPAHNIIKLPQNISNAMGAILDPLGNAVHSTLSFDLVGEDVLITGAGPIGLMSIAIAKQIGARYIIITDINEYRLKLAKDLGATFAININQNNFKKEFKSIIQQLDLEEGFTVGLEMSGQPDALQLLLKEVGFGASIGLLGIPDHNFEIDWNKIIFKGLTLKGIYGRKMFETWDKMLHLLQIGLNIEPIITHHFKIEDFKSAFETARLGQAGKIVLLWN